GPFMSWKRADLAAVMQRLLAAGILAMVAIVTAYWLKHGGPVLAPLGIGLGIWLIAGAFSELASRSKLFREPLPVAMRRLFGLPRSAWGSAIAHAGLGVVVLGVVAVSAWRVEHISVMKPGDQITIAGLDLHYLGSAPRRGPNYEDQVGTFRAERGGAEIATLESAKRVYTVRNMPTTEAAIYPLWTGDLYISLGDATDGGGRTVRVYYNPLAPLIWIGAVIMFLGGGISLTDRRYRVGAPKRARRAEPQTTGAA
ncbi:MAG: cytochrome c-type biogenesis CcmF C-terminal domain-containing protein, partial [Hyphomicrobiales bacterium]